MQKVMSVDPLNPPPPAPPAKFAVCLLADVDAYDRLGPALRFLTVGLLDQSVVPILIGPAPTDTALSGPIERIAFEPPRWPLTRLATWWLADDVSRRLDDLRIDTPPVVHALSPRMASFAAHLAAGGGTDPLVSVDDLQIARSPTAMSAIPANARLVTSSDVVRAVLATSLDVATIRPGVPSAGRAHPLRDPRRQAAIAYAGPLRDENAMDLLLRAFAELRRDHSDTLLFVIGHGPAEPGMRRLANELQLTERVMFTGRLEPWGDALTGADLLCLPAAETAVSVVPIQAMALGLPVIAAAGSAHDCLIDERTAWLFPAGDGTALTEQLRRVLQDPAAAAALAARGQAYVAAEHGPGRMVEGYARLYQSLALKQRTLRLPDSP
jgi:glycosyltransferase involved in cell wall biosynthesis